MINALIQRLRAEVPELKLVGGAAEFAQASASNPTVTPAAYVLTPAEKPSPSAIASVLIQHVKAEIPVVLVTRNVADAHGAAAAIDMQALRLAVRAKVFGWVPADGCDPLELGPGQMLAFREGHYWHQDSFSTAYYARSAL